MNIRGTVTIDLADYHLLKNDSEKWLNALKVADEIKEVQDLIIRGDYSKSQIVEMIKECENKLRRGY